MIRALWPSCSLVLSCCIALGITPPCAAQTDAPKVAISSAQKVVGLWRAVDDKTKKPSSLIRLLFEDNKLIGRVEKVLNPKVGANPMCTKCRGDRANKPLTGMTILWGLEAEGDAFTGGEVLDPGSGSTYRCKIKLLSPNTLEVRGYLGFSALGRSQIWQREPESNLGGVK